MTTGELAYLVFVNVAFFVFLIAIGIATWRTEGPPAWFARRGATRSPAEDREPGGAAPARQ
jgi:hypothetical protein